MISSIFSEIDFMMLTPPTSKTLKTEYHSYTDPPRCTKVMDIGRLCLSEKKKIKSVNMENKRPPKIQRQPGPLIKEASAPNLPVKERMGWMDK